jgi:CubicO group peptidase (beta-lactamase class C family)
MKKYRAWRSVPLFLAAIVGCRGGPSAQKVTAHIDQIENKLNPVVLIRGEPAPGRTLAERMGYYRVPGVSIAVFDDFEVEWARGYGLADVEEGRPVTEHTLFQAASLGKPVTATAALALVDDGRLDLDEDVNESLVSWNVPLNAYTEVKPVTLRRLLSHTAGTTVQWSPGYEATQAIPTSVELLEGKGNTKPVRVDMEPGSMWRFSGGGYTVVQQLLTDVVDEGFPALMAAIVFEPAGMVESTFEQPLPPERWEDAASGYRANGKRVEGRWRVYPDMAAAGLWTTPSDYARWAIELQRAYAGRSEAMLSREMAREMLEPVMNDWGLGPAIAPDGTRFSHSGASQGFRSQFVAFFKGGRGAVVMTNSDSGAGLIHELMINLGSIYGWPGIGPTQVDVVQLEPALLREYAGRYKFPGLGVIVIEAGENRLFADVPSFGRVTMAPLSETEFVDLGEGSKIAFVRQDDRVSGFKVQGYWAEKVR